MARTSPRRLTRLDREAAREAARRTDVGPIIRGVLAVAAVLVVTYLLGAVIPERRGAGGPLQGAVAGSGSFTVLRKTRGDDVSLVIPVPWNAGSANAILEAIAPIGADGLLVKRTGVVPPGSSSVDGGRGFPPEGVTMLPLRGYTAEPGLGELDGFQVVVGVEGEGTVSAFALSYRVGGTTYVAILPDGALVCAAGCDGGSAVAEDEQRGVVTDLEAFVTRPER